MALVHVVIDRRDPKSRCGHDTILKLNAARGRENGGMIEEHALSEFDPVSEIADERSQDADIIQFPAEKFFQIRDIARIIRHSRICPGAERPSPHHFVDCLLEVRLTIICRTALVHQFIYIALFVIHIPLLTEDRWPSASAADCSLNWLPGSQ